MLKLLKWWIIGGLFLSPFCGFTQITITILDAPEALVACGNAGTFQLYLSESQGNFPGGNLVIQMPTGMTYVPGSANGAMELNTSNSGFLEFFVPAAGVGFHSLSFDAVIDCRFTNNQAIQYIFTTGGATTTASQPPLSNFYYPEIVATNIQNTSLSLALGQSGNRIFTIIQARAGARIDSLFVVSSYNSAIQTSSFDNGQLVGSGPSGDTLLITGNALPGGDGFFNFGDTLTLTETVSLLTCASGNTRLELYWRCNGELCQSFFSDGLTALANGAPSIQLTNQNGFGSQTVANDAAQVGGGFCQTLDLLYLIENNGAEAAFGAGAAYDLTIAFGLNNNLYIGALPADISRFPNWSMSAWIDNNPLPLSGFNFPNPNPMLGYNIRFNTLATDPDGPGGLDDLDGDGFFDDLAVGESTTIRIAIEYDPTATDDCEFLSGFLNTGGAQTSFRIGFHHYNQCGNSSKYWYGVGDPGINVVELFVHRENIPLLSFENVNLVPGETSYLYIRPAGDWSSPCAPTDSFILQLILPDGLMLGQGPALGPGLNYGYVGNSGDTLLFAGTERGALDAPWEIPLEIDCNSAVFDSTLELSFRYFCDPTCPYSKVIDCKRLVLDYLPQCADCQEGIVTRGFQLERQSLGYQDVYHTQKVDPITQPTINLKAGLNRDSVAIQLAGVYRGVGPFDSLYARISYAPVALPQIQPDIPHLQPIGGTLHYFPANGGTLSCDFDQWELLFDASRNRHFMELDLEHYFQPGACLESINRAAGDSISLTLMTQVTDNTPFRAQSIPELLGGFYSVIEGRDTSCNRFLDQFVIEEVVPIVHVSYGVQQHFGCEEIFFTGSFINNHGHQVDGDQFPDEIRSISEVQEVRIYLEGNWYYQPGTTTIRASGSLNAGNGGSILAPGVTVGINDPVVSFDGINTVLTYTNPGNWPAGDVAINGSDPQQNIRFRAVPSCSVPQDSFFLISMEADFIKFTHAPPDQQLAVTESSSTIAKSYEGQQSEISLVSPQIANPINDTVSWAFLLENITSYAGADKSIYNNWFAVEADPGVSILSLIDRTNSGDPITYLPINYGPDKVWFQVGDLGAFKGRTFELIGLFQDCEESDLKVFHGFNCEAYPDPDPDSGYAFPSSPYSCAIDSFSLDIRPGEIALALELNDPPLPVDACTPLTYSLDITNLQLPYAYGLRVEAVLPEGLLLNTGTSMLEFPTGSGNLIPLPDPISLGFNHWAWNIANQLTQLKGITREPENQCRLYFEVETTCDFLSGRQLQLEATASTNCGQEDRKQVYSLPLVLDGVPPVVSQYRVEMDFPDGGIRNCASTEIRYKMVNLGPFPTPSIAYSAIALPHFLNYQSGSVTAIHNGPSVLDEERLIDDIRLLSFSIPQGIAVGDSVVFTIMIDDPLTEPFLCETINIEGLVLLKADLPCSSAPGGSCPIYSIAEAESFTIPSIPNDYSAMITDWSSMPFGGNGEWVSGQVVIQNNTTYDIVNDSIRLSVFHDANGNGVLDLPQEAILKDTTIWLPAFAGGGSLENTIQFFGASDQVGALALAITDIGHQCICDTIYLAAPPLQLNNTGQEVVVCHQDTVYLGVDDRPSPIEFEWIPINGSPASAIHQPQQGITTATFENTSTAPIQYQYILSTTRPGGFTSIDTALVTVLPQLLATASPATDYNGQDISCNGALDGSLAIAMLYGTAPYSFQLGANTQTDSLFEGLTAGVYQFQITDANGCSQTTEGELMESEPLAGDLSIDSISCLGAGDGQVHAAIEGGTPPYEYEWSISGSSNTSSIDNLEEGWYFLTLSDANGCQLVDSAQLIAPMALSADVQLSPASCHDALDGSATLENIIGGNPPFTYLWEDNSTNIDNQNLNAGPHEVTIEDSEGCLFILSFEIAAPAEISLEDFSLSHLSCFESDDGAIQIQPTGGTLPFAYVWNTSSEDQNLSDLTIGSYQFTLTDANNCIFESPVFEISQPDLLELNVVEQLDVSCFEGQDGFAAVQPIGGTPPYSYLWPDGQIDSTVNDLPAGTHQVQVMDQNDCIAFVEVFIAEPSPLESILSLDAISCQGGADGQLFASIAGGTPPYEYTWSIPANLTDTSIDNLEEGWYFLTLTDAKGCQLIDSAQLIAPPTLSAELVTEPSSCPDTFDGSAALENISGGTPPYSYLWEDNDTNIDNYNLSAGPHEVTVEDSEGCLLVLAFNIAAPPTLSLEDFSLSHLSCFESEDGAIEILPDGGVPPYSYVWNTNGQSQNLTDLAAGIYQFTLTDANNCIFESPVFEITQPDLLQLNVVEQLGVSCFSGQDGSASVHAIGGTAPYTFQWPEGQDESIVNSLAPGAHIVQVTDQNECSASVEVFIAEPDPLESSLTIDGISCQGGADGQLFASIAGGTAPYEYAWSVPANLTDNNIDNLEEGWYFLTLTDANGCQLIDSAQLIAPPALAAELQLETASCHDALDGNAVLENVSGGTPPYTYLWEDGQTTIDNQQLGAGPHQVSVEDNEGCILVLPFTIEAPVELKLSQFLLSNLRCFESEDGAIQIIPEGGTPPYAYQWNTGSASQNLSDLAAGTYQLTLTDANSCIFESPDFVLTQPSQLQLNVQEQNGVSCFGDQDGSAEIQAIGGTAPYSYQWPDGQLSKTVEGLAPGTYAVSVMDAQNCTALAQVLIAEPQSLEANTQLTPPDCNGVPGSILLTPTAGTGTPPYRYSIDGGVNFQDDNLFDGLEVGDYDLAVIDANGCLFFLMETLSPLPPIQLYLPDFLSMNFGESVSTELEIIDASGNVQIQWHPNDPTISCINCLTPTFTPPYSTEYYVEVLDENGCIARARLPVIVKRPRRLFVPNSFSPNNDGFNDLLVAYGGPEVVLLEKMLIADRWGNIVYEQHRIPHSDDQYGWDGTFQGKPVNSGVYVYMIEALFTDGERQLFKGSINVIR